MFHVHLSPLGKANQVSSFSEVSDYWVPCIWVQKPVSTLLTYLRIKLIHLQHEETQHVLSVPGVTKHILIISEH